VVTQLGGAAQLEISARQTKAFVRRRQIPDAVSLLRLMLAYCLGERGLRSTATWAASVGLADLSSVALFYRLRQCGDWFAVLVEGLLAAAAPKASRGRLIRIVDATTVPQAGPAARRNSELWRVHSAFDLPFERFGHFELTDQQEGETFDRIPVVKSEIRIGDRAYLQPDRIAAVREAGADVLIRAGWKNARWLDAKGLPFDLMAQLRAAKARGLIDRRIWINARTVRLWPCVWSQSRSPPVRPLLRVVKPGETHKTKTASSPKKLWKPRIGSFWSHRLHGTSSPPRMCSRSIDCDGGSNLASSD
jgi:hypothetical protein